MNQSLPPCTWECDNEEDEDEDECPGVHKGQAEQHDVAHDG